MCIVSCPSRRTTIDNPRHNTDCGVRLGEGTFPSPRALSILSTRSSGRQCRPLEREANLSCCAPFDRYHSNGSCQHQDSDYAKR